jgi:hypothetical protein
VGVIKVIVAHASSLKLLDKSNFLEQHFHLVWVCLKVGVNGQTTKKIQKASHDHMATLIGKTWQDGGQPIDLGHTIFRQSQIYAG